MSTTDTITIDAWLEAGRAGMTDERLADVFDLVKPADNWKLPIAARVAVDDATADELDTAIAWFAGGLASVEPIFMAGTDVQVAWWVEAPGYYNAVGA